MLKNHSFYNPTYVDNVFQDSPSMLSEAVIKNGRPRMRAAVLLMLRINRLFRVCGVSESPSSRCSRLIDIALSGLEFSQRGAHPPAIFVL